MARIAALALMIGIPGSTASQQAAVQQLLRRHVYEFRLTHFTVASLRPELCRVGPGYDIHLPGPLQGLVLHRKATAVRRVLRGMSSCRPCTEVWKCGRFPADRLPYPAGVSGPDEASHNR